MKLHLRCGKILSIKPRKYFTFYGELFAVHRALEHKMVFSKTDWIATHYNTGACLNSSTNTNVNDCITCACNAMSVHGKRQTIKAIKNYPTINTKKTS